MSEMSLKASNITKKYFKRKIYFEKLVFLKADMRGCPWLSGMIRADTSGEFKDTILSSFIGKQYE